MRGPWLEALPLEMMANNSLASRQTAGCACTHPWNSRSFGVREPGAGASFREDDIDAPGREKQVHGSVKALQNGCLKKKLCASSRFKPASQHLAALTSPAAS